MERTTAIPKTNPKRKAKRAAEDVVYGSFFRYVRTLPCAVMGEGSPCIGAVDGHHMRSVGAGGQDAANTVPLCRGHHSEWHTIGPKRFDARYFNDLRMFAEILWRRYCEGFSQESA